MKTLGEVASLLSQIWLKSEIKKGILSDKTGLSAPTLRGLLSGRKDSKLTTLFAVVDQLGYEVVIVPKVVAQSFKPSTVSESLIKTLIDNAVAQHPSLLNSRVIDESENPE